MSVGGLRCGVVMFLVVCGVLPLAGSWLSLGGVLCGVWWWFGIVWLRVGERMACGCGCVVVFGLCGAGVVCFVGACEGGGLVLVCGLAGPVSGGCGFLFALGPQGWSGWTCWLKAGGGGRGLRWGWFWWLLAARVGSPEVGLWSREGLWLSPWMWVLPSLGVGVVGGVGSRRSWLGGLCAGWRCLVVSCHSWRGAWVLFPVFPGPGVVSFFWMGTSVVGVCGLVMMCGVYSGVPAGGGPVAGWWCVARWWRRAAAW